MDLSITGGGIKTLHEVRIRIENNRIIGTETAVLKDLAMLRLTLDEIQRRIDNNIPLEPTSPYESLEAWKAEVLKTIAIRDNQILSIKYAKIENKAMDWYEINGDSNKTYPLFPV